MPRMADSLPKDALSGFLVFLIALPLCIGISLASGFPPMAGIFTAIIGGLLATWISNSELTIKGPAAGLIAIAIAAITEFEKLAPHLGYTEETAKFGAYQLVLGVCVIAALCQIGFGLFRAGVLVEFFPISAVHGMLAAIGIIIISKQVHVLVGVKPVAKEPLELLHEIGHSLMHLNPATTLIGVLSLVILFGMPFVKNPAIRKIPAAMLVLFMAVPLGRFLELQNPLPYQLTQGAFDSMKAGGHEVPAAVLDKLAALKDQRFESSELLSAELTKCLTADELAAHQKLILECAERKATCLGLEYSCGPKFLVDLKPKKKAAANSDSGTSSVSQLPAGVANLVSAVTAPDFHGVLTGTGIKFIIMFALVGSLESLLSAKAIDLLDPWRRKTNFNRELLAVGMANTLSASIGGLPMISEIVRSSANINNGARTRLANFSHGSFLLLFVASLPWLIEMIPLSALAAMLVYTGCRLASPKEFISTYRIGSEQLMIFVATIFLTLATDLLVGVAAGIAVKMVTHYFNGVKPKSFFKLHVDVEARDEKTDVITVHEAAIFSNWIPFKRMLEHIGFEEGKNVMVDLTQTQLVDHTVVEKLHQLHQEFEERGQHFDVIGLEGHRTLSEHPLAARKRGLVPVRRITIYINHLSEKQLLGKLAELGATGFTSSPISGAGRKMLAHHDLTKEDGVRIEVLVTPDVAKRVIGYIDRELLPDPACHVTACVETVMVLRANAL